MQKRLKESIWPEQKKEAVQPIQQSQLSALDKFKQLKSEMPHAAYVRQAFLIPGVIPLSPATLWRWVASENFPKPVKIGPRVTAWRIDDIIKWLTSKQPV